MKGTRPVASLILQKKWDSLDRGQHRIRLKNIRSSNYAKSPAVFIHVKNNYKRKRLAEERCTEIERENRILLEKMTKMYEPRSRSLSKLRPQCRKRSLNDKNRNREFKRISSGNRALLDRLKKSSPVINVSQFDRE